MPESIRSLLHDIGDDHAEPERDLAAGAYRKARSMTRKRMAAGAAGVAAALAIAGTGTAAWLGDERDPGPGPAEDQTTVTEDVTTTEEEVAGESSCTVSVEDWDGLDFTFPARGDSGTAGPLTALPEGMLFRGANADEVEVTYAVVDGAAQALDEEGDYLYEPAPDGSRAIAVSRADWCGAAYQELGDSELEAVPVFSMDTVACPITWSPDSNRVVFTEMGGSAEARSYVLDVSTGELTDLPAELYCTAKWLPDSEHLWDGQGTVMRYDGTDPVEVEPLSDSEPLLAAGMSADMGEACLHRTEGDGVGWRCDEYIDMATGEQLELPVVGAADEDEMRQVEFLEDGSMIIVEQTPSEATAYLVGADGELLDEMALPQEVLGGYSVLLSWFTD
ncbi:hypothetical protein AB0A73_17035 [Glycomyces sp. NPDC047369]